MLGEMFATAVQVLDPHIVLHVSISRVNRRPCIENTVLVCWPVFLLMNTELMWSAVPLQAMSSNFYCLTTFICSQKC